MPADTETHVLEPLYGGTPRGIGGMCICLADQDKARGAHRGTLHRHDGGATVEIALGGGGGGYRRGAGGVMSLHSIRSH